MNAFWEAFMAEEVVLCTPEVARKPWWSVLQAVALP